MTLVDPGLGGGGGGEFDVTMELEQSHSMANLNVVSTNLSASHIF